MLFRQTNAHTHAHRHTRTPRKVSDLRQEQPGPRRERISHSRFSHYNSMIEKYRKNEGCFSMRHSFWLSFDTYYKISGNEFATQVRKVVLCGSGLFRGSASRFNADSIGRQLPLRQSPLHASNRATSVFRRTFKLKTVLVQHHQTESLSLSLSSEDS